MDIYFPFLKTNMTKRILVVLTLIIMKYELVCLYNVSMTPPPCVSVFLSDNPIIFSSAATLRHHVIVTVHETITCLSHYTASSYPQPPNLCTEAVIDRVTVMRTWILAHGIKPRNNQSTILFPPFGRSIPVLHNADS